MVLNGGVRIGGFNLQRHHPSEHQCVSSPGPRQTFCGPVLCPVTEQMRTDASLEASPLRQPLRVLPSLLQNMTAFYQLSTDFDLVTPDFCARLRWRATPRYAQELPTAHLTALNDISFSGLRIQ